MVLSALTIAHVVISLVGIAAGFAAAAGMLNSSPPRRWTNWFMATTALTSLTGFLFPFTHLLPSHIVAILSLVLLAVAAFALYGKQLASFWRLIFVLTAAAALYLNVFVLIIQGFLKVPALKALAPTQTEPAFIAVQVGTLLLFFALTVLVLFRFRSPSAARMAA